MRLALRGALLCAAGVQVSQGALLRASVAGEQSGLSDAEKVERLLLDVDESIKKAGSDAEFVYTSLYNYDAQLESSLDREIKRVRQELAKLHNASKATASMAAAATAGRLSDGRSQLDKVFETIRILTDFMTHGSMSKVHLNDDEQHAGRAVVLTGSLKTLRLLLASHQDLRPHFVDVFEAFVPAPPVALVQAHVATKMKKAPLKVHLTPQLRQHTAAALAAIKERLARAPTPQEALLQTHAASTVKAATEGMLAEQEQEVQELQFSTTFAEAVVKIDAEFQAKVHDSIAKKASIVEAIRRSRDAQHRSLGALVDLLRGRYLATDAVGDEDADANAAAAPSFVQVAGPRPSALQLQLEAAIRSKGDTHAILMKVKSMLDRSVPVDTEGAGTVVRDFSKLLREVQSEQSRADELKARCERQATEGGEEERELRANLALMSVVQNRTKASIAKAQLNLKRILAKLRALEREAKETGDVVTKGARTLEDQSKDRHTIAVAVQKAREIVADRTSAGPAADSLLAQMLQDLRIQDSQEHEYRSAEVGLRASFDNYVQAYKQLLEERRGHYETALSSLELYAGEVDADAATEADAIESNRALASEGGSVCDGILQAYVSDSDRRSSLGVMLQSVVPELPKVLQ